MGFQEASGRFGLPTLFVNLFPFFRTRPLFQWSVKLAQLLEEDDTPKILDEIP